MVTMSAVRLVGAVTQNDKQLCFNQGNNGNARNRMSCRVRCQGPTPAWPGRAPVPEASPMRSAGPKVRWISCHFVT